MYLSRTWTIHQEDSDGTNHRVYSVVCSIEWVLVQYLFPRPKWGPPTPSPAGKCFPPRGHNRLRVKGWGGQIRTRGQVLWYSRYRCTLYSELMCVCFNICQKYFVGLTEYAYKKENKMIKPCYILYSTIKLGEWMKLAKPKPQTCKGRNVINVYCKERM